MISNRQLGIVIKYLKKDFGEIRPIECLTLGLDPWALMGSSDGEESFRKRCASLLREKESREGHMAESFDCGFLSLPYSHRKALERIRDDAYPGQSFSHIIMEMIEDYIMRENGRLGEFKVTTSKAFCD